MGAIPLWSVKDVLCLTIARTSTLRMASRGRSSQELLEGSLGREGVCAGVYKRTSSNDPSLSTVSFAVSFLGGVEMRIYPLSLLLNVLTTGIL